MSCAVARRSLDPMWLWLWHRPVAAAPIQPLAWELLYAQDVALRCLNKKKKKKKKKCLFFFLNVFSPTIRILAPNVITYTHLLSPTVRIKPFQNCYTL